MADKERISYWSNGKLITKKFSSIAKMEEFVIQNDIREYYWCGYLFMKI